MFGSTSKIRNIMLGTFVCLSIGTFTGAGRADATAAGCTGGLPGGSSNSRYTGARCTGLSGGNIQRPYQWCPSVGAGWMYGPWTGTAGQWTYTLDCGQVPTNRGQQIN